MSFFAKIAQSEMPPRRRTELPQSPEWAAPPQWVIPGRSAQHAVVFRSPSAVLTVGRFDAFPSGVQFEVTLYVRGDIDIARLPWDHPRRTILRQDETMNDDLLRLGIAFADGQVWSNTVEAAHGHQARPEGPIVSGRSGSGGSGEWRQTCWLWPLPPDGDLLIFAQWPAFGIDEAVASINATELRQRSLEAESVW